MAGLVRLGRGAASSKLLVSGSVGTATIMQHGELR